MVYIWKAYESTIVSKYEYKLNIYTYFFAFSKMGFWQDKKRNQ